MKGERSLRTESADRARKGFATIALYGLVSSLCKESLLIFERGTMRTGALLPSWVNAFACGMCFLLALYSLSLYVQKRSEGYLLWLSLIAALTFMRTLAGSPELSRLAPEGMLEMMRTPLDIFLVVICSGLCFWLTDSRLPGKWDELLRPAGLLTVYGVLMFLRYTIGGSFLQRFIASTPYYAAAVCLMFACMEDKPCAWLLMAGMAARFGLRSYLSASSGDTSLYAYIASAQLDFLTFVLTCLLAINHKFAGKFNESERLAAQLQRMNSGLDALVDERTAQLRQANEVILAQQKARQNLMTNIFHDLRSPLFVLRGYTEMMEALGPENMRRKRLMQERLDFLSRLVEDLFLTAKLEDGKVSFSLEETALLPLCRAAAQAHELEAARQRVFLQAEGEECCARADGFRLGQALENLTENALRYTPAGGKVILSCGAEGENVCLTVRDTGPGIAPEDLPHVFERYYQGAHDSRSTGLGLSIAHSLAEGMGGALQVKSHRGVGTEFSIRLPKWKEV